MSSGRFGVAILADTDPDPQVLERLKHGPVEERTVRLNGHVNLCWHSGAERRHQIGQPWPSGEQWFATVQDDVDAVKAVHFRMFGDALYSLTGDRRAHPLRQLPPGLIRHFIHIAV